MSMYRSGPGKVQYAGIRGNRCTCSCHRHWMATKASQGPKQPLDEKDAEIARLRMQRDQLQSALSSLVKVVDADVWPVLALYSQEVVQSGVTQKKALVCAICSHVWEFSGEDTDGDVIKMAQEYGYRLVRKEVVCDDCLADKERDK